jgi:hypothetical protein
LNQILNRHALGQRLTPHPDALNLRKRFFQTDIVAGWNRHGSQFSTPCNSNALAAARPLYLGSDSFCFASNNPIFFIAPIT